jgi:hypothetical protein
LLVRIVYAVLAKGRLDSLMTTLRLKLTDYPARVHKGDFSAAGRAAGLLVLPIVRMRGQIWSQETRPAGDERFFLRGTHGGGAPIPTAG